MNLVELQRAVLSSILSPTRPRRDHIAAVVKANSRLSSLERLDIYRASYWTRVLDSLEDDFGGLLSLLGRRAFGRLAKAYLSDHPSGSFSLRNLGSRLETWLGAHPAFAGRNPALALDMVRLEWAHIEAFDAAAKAPIGPGDLLEPGPELRLSLQPHLSLLKLHYAVDDLRGRAATWRLKIKPQTVYLAVHRTDFDVYYRRLEPEEFAILAALRHGEPLGDAVEAASFDAPIETWFAAWARLGWLCHPEKES